MNKRHYVLFLLCCTALASAPGRAQEAALTAPAVSSPDRYSASFRMGFNITADFKNIGSFGAQGHLVPIPGQGDVLQAARPNGDSIGNRTYENGFVWVDSSGNAFDYSRYWGYDSSSQLNAANGTIVMNTSSSPGTSSKDRDGDPQMGFEVTYNRRFGLGEKWRWGLEATFNYMNITIGDQHPLNGSGTLLSDAFRLPPNFEGGGYVLPPPAPYSHGPFLTPETGNTVLGATPNRLPDQTFATAIAGSRHFDADVFGSRFGPYGEVALSPKFAIAFSGGLALAAIKSEFSYRESVTFDEGIGTGTATRSAAASGSESDILVGAYASALFNFSITEKWILFAGGQFQYLGHYSHREANHEARLDLSQSVFVNVGLSLSF